MKEMEEGAKKQKGICAQTGRIKIVKMSTLPKAICISSTIPTEIPVTFFTKRKNAPKLVWNHKRSQIVNRILSKRSTDRNITIPDFRTNYKVVETNTTWYWLINRHTD
jgi:hypothetical protein